jgi:hypothetical protein
MIKDLTRESMASLDGFIQYVTILFNSNKIDKAMLSFYIIDQGAKGYLVQSDFDFILKRIS